MHELPNNTECQVIIDPKYRVKHYEDDAIDHDSLLKDIRALKPWNPYESSNIEEKKWQTYFELYKKIIKERKVNFTLSDINIKKEKLFARPNPIPKEIAHTDTNNEKSSPDVESEKESFQDKIKDAKGEDVRFDIESFQSDRKGKRYETLGKSEGLDSKIEIRLDRNYEKSLHKLIKNKKEHLHLEDGETPEIRFLSKENFDQKIEKWSKKEVNFYLHGEACFQADVVIEERQEEQQAEPSENDSPKEQVNIYHINESTVAPLNLCCSVDYFSEKYQVDVMERCFDKVKKMEIWQVLSGERVSKLPGDVDINFDNPKLNEEQKNAIRGAIAAEELFLIWGPPGTGKTEVIKEIAKYESMNGNKTLIASQSNLAVDNALARLYGEDDCYPFRIAKEGYKLEGEDERKVPFLESVPRFSLDLLKNRVCRKDNEDELVKHFLEDMDKAGKRLVKKEKSDMELREFKQLAELYKNNINVVGSTLMESGRKNKLLDRVGFERFDTVIIDEVSKATPPELFIPIPLGKKLILVGDHKQLPPMFKMLSGDDKPLEQWAEEVGMDQGELDIENTIFERLWDRHAEDAAKCRSMLTKQYRMHGKIQKLIEPFYTDEEEGSLSLGLSEGEMEKLKIEDSFFGNAAMWIGTRSCDSEKGLEKKDGTSFYNEDEIRKVGQLLDKLLKLNNAGMSIGVITFYGAQLKRLKQKYQNQYKDKFGEGKLIFGTVDRFQGRECDVIICSLVRNNKTRHIGFASKVNRINVGFSRARKCLIILGSKEQFAYESDKIEKQVNAQTKYKHIYDHCHRVKPKDLE